MQRLSKPQSSRSAQPGSARRQRDGGFLLLAIMLMMAFMIIAATIAAPRVVQQLKRDREEEMIHRGTQYARAIKKFYKKNGRYPASLDDLDKGQIKFLRQRYKDPLTKDGKWKLLNYGDIQSILNTAAPGTPAASLGTLGGGSSLTPGGAVVPNSSSGTGFSQATPQQQQQQQLPGSVTTGFPSNSDTGGNAEGQPSGNNSGADSKSGGQIFSIGGSNNPSGNQPGGTTGNQASSPFGSNSNNGQSFGGGAIVGVASASKEETIRIYNKKKTYNEWQFIYNPMMDQGNTLLQGPYQPTTIGGGQFGTPASQMNPQQPQPNSPFNSNPSSSPFGQQSGVGTTSPQASPSPQ